MDQKTYSKKELEKLHNLQLFYIYKHCTVISLTKWKPDFMPHEISLKKKFKKRNLIFNIKTWKKKFKIFFNLLSKAREGNVEKKVIEKYAHEWINPTNKLL